MSGAGRYDALLFVPIIKGIEYEFEVNNNSNTSVKVKTSNNNNQPILLANQINADLYLEIDRNKPEVRKFNNVFVLFGVVASNNNGKIKMQITLDPCDYVRGFVFKVDANLLQQGGQLNQIFDGCDRFEINRKSFAILNRYRDSEIIGNFDRISICIAKDIYIGNTEPVNVNNRDNIIEVTKDRQLLNISDDAVKIFKYSTPKS